MQNDHDSRRLPLLAKLLCRRIRIADRLTERLIDIFICDLEPLKPEERFESKLLADRVLGLLGDICLDLLDADPGVLDVLLDRHLATFQTGDKVPLDLLTYRFDHHLRDFAFEPLGKRLANSALMRLHSPDNLRSIQIGFDRFTHILHGVVSSGVLSELVVDLRKELRLDLVYRHIERGLLADVFGGTGRLGDDELGLGLIAGLHPDDVLLKVFGHKAGTHLVEVLVDLVALVVLAIDLPYEGEEHEILFLDTAVLDRFECRKTIAHLVDLFVDLLVGGFLRRDFDGQSLDRGKRELRTDGDLGNEYERLAGLHELDLIHLGLLDGSDALGIERLCVARRENVVLRIGKHGVPPDMGVDDRLWSLAGSEPGNLDLLGHALVGLIDGLVDIFDLNGHR